MCLSVSLPRMEESKSNVHPTFGISNGQPKHKKEWVARQGKVLFGGLIFHRYMRKGKRPPSHTHLPNVTKSVFAFSSYAYKILATLQPSIPSTRCWDFPSSLGCLVPSPPQTWIWTFGTTFPLLLLLSCLIFSAHIPPTLCMGSRSFKSNLCLFVCPSFLGFHCIQACRPPLDWKIKSLKVLWRFWKVTTF